jgi:hypothetical protein
MGRVYRAPSGSKLSIAANNRTPETKAKMSVAKLGNQYRSKTYRKAGG